MSAAGLTRGAPKEETSLSAKNHNLPTPVAAEGNAGTAIPLAVPPRAVLPKGVPMKKLLVLAFAFALVTSLTALAQGTYPSEQTKPDTAKAEKATKAISLSGKLSDDGKTFVDKDGKSWTVSNPEAVKGHEGHEVTLKAHTDPIKNEVHVVSAKMGKDEMKDETKK
jgi:hypothetical protein